MEIRVNAGENDRLSRLHSQLRDGLFTATEEGHIVEANPAFLTLLGAASLQEVLGNGALKTAIGDEGWDRLGSLLQSEGSVRAWEMDIRSLDGKLRTVLCTAFRDQELATGPVFIQGLLVDITDRKRFEEKLLELSHRDPLTGCFNRRYLDQFARKHQGRSEPWGCILIDVDRFKGYNDKYGHDAGDQVLVRLSRFLIRRTRADEGVVRMGGDEFLLLLTNADETVTEHVADRLRLAASGENLAPFSLGCASRENGEWLERTIDRADQKLMLVKSAERAPRRRRREGSSLQDTGPLVLAEM